MIFNETNILSANFSSLKDNLSKISTDHLIFIIDSNLYEMYNPLFDDLKKIKKKNTFVQVPSGEKCKTFACFQTSIHEILNDGVHRNSHIISIGGGATSDLAGYIASSLLRGILWSVVPTSILAMVDAAVGGKVSINTEQGKNLIGSFHFPENVFICNDFIKTLSLEEKESGHGEVLKYAFLNEEIYHNLDNKDLYLYCAKFKQTIVMADPYEKDLRMQLNFGHTFGHAYEKLTGIAHGQSVLWGISFIDKYFMDSKFENQIQVVKEKLNLRPSFQEIKTIDLFEYVKNDKKKISNNELNLVLLEDIGKPILQKVSLDSIYERLL